jgi:hypothetical protein
LNVKKLFYNLAYFYKQFFFFKKMIQNKIKKLKRKFFEAYFSKVNIGSFLLSPILEFFYSVLTKFF